MFTFSQWVELLVKARGHKYIKRIPYNTPKGRRYRYIYNVTHSHRGKHAMDESHLKVGTAFMTHTESGSEVHGHIKSVSGDRVTYVLDDGPNKGQEVTKTKSEIVAMLNEKHNVNEQVQSKRDALKRQLATARENNASEKQIARIQERLDRLGGEPAEEKSEGLNPQFASILEKHRVSPEELDIKKWYKRGAPRGFKNGEVSGKGGNAPDAAMYRRLMGIADRREEVCAKYNAGLEKSLSEIQERVAPLLAKQEKLNKEIETLVATPTELTVHQYLRKNLADEIDAINFDIRDDSGNRIFSEDTRTTEIAFHWLESSDPEAFKKILAVLKKYGVPAPDGGTQYPWDYIVSNQYKLVSPKKLKTYKTADEKKAKRQKLQEQKDALNKEIEAQFSDLMFQDTPDDYDEIMSSEKAEWESFPRVFYGLQNDGYTGKRKEATPRHSHLAKQFEERFGAIYPEMQNKRIHMMYTGTQRESCAPEYFGATVHASAKTNDTTMIHECAHSLEFHVPHLVDMVTLAVSKRVQANKRTKISSKESAFADEFHSDYTGKLYNYRDRVYYRNFVGHSPSEVITMGVQEIRKGALARLLSTDLHHFAFTYGVMKGHFK